MKIACIQLNAQSDIEANLAAAEPIMQQAVAAGATMLCLPENAFYMRGDEAHGLPDFTTENHPALQACATWAKAWQVWLLIGSVAVASPTPSRWLNRSVLINPQGQITAQYDKLHRFDVTLPNGETYEESARFDAGTHGVLARIPCGVLGMSICYDLRFPQLYRALAQAGATVLSVPAAFTYTTGTAHWHSLLRARAIENGCYVVAPAQCGTHPKGRRTYGHSLIIDPWGQVLADGGDQVGYVIAELDAARVAEVRSQIPSLQHDVAFSLAPLS